MGTSERPTFPSEERVTADWLKKQPNLNNSDVFIKVTGMVQRSVRDVLGGALESEAINHLRFSPKYNMSMTRREIPRVGAEAFHQTYAHTVAAVTKAMGWDEGYPQLTLFCLTLYDRIVAGSDNERAPQTLDRLRPRIRDFITTQSSQIDLEQNDLLSEIFDLSNSQRTSIYKLLRKPQTYARAFQRLREYAEDEV